MVIKVGINSFGRIGRVIFRTCCQNSEIEVSAINDPAIDLDYMCYLIKFDSTHGKFTGDVSYQNDEIKINDSRVKVFHNKIPGEIPWQQAGVQYVIEASGMFTNLEKASGHLTSGVRKVIVTAPSADAPMIILGVNEDRIGPDTNVISCASSTLYCLAPIVKVLEDAFGVSEGFVTSIHAMTPSLKPLDGLCVRGKHWRDHRSIHQNIIPASTGACKALGKIIPSCKDKLAGLAFRVPIVNVSLLDMSVRLNKNTTIAEISQYIKTLRNLALRNIIQVSNEKTVSSDFIGDTHSCTLDIDSSLQIAPNFFKLICWYENEYSYSCRVVDTLLFLERQRQMQILPSITRITYGRPLCYMPISENKRNRDCVHFRVPNLQSSGSNFTNSHSFIMRPSARSSPTYHIVEQKDLIKNTETVQSYIDGLTNCKCNAVQKKSLHLENKTHPPLDARERAKAKDCLKKVEKEISEMLNMTEDLLNKSTNKKLKSLPSVKHTSEEETSKRDGKKELSMLRENIIAKISDTIEKIRKEKRKSSSIEIDGDHKSLVLDIDDYEAKISESARETDSLNNSNLKLRRSISSSKIDINNVASSNLPLKASNTFIVNYPCEHWAHKLNIQNSLNKPNEIHFKDDLKLQITKENKILHEGKTEHVNRVSSDNFTSVNEKKYIDEEVILIVSENLEPAIKSLNAISQDNSNRRETSLRDGDKESIGYYEVKMNASDIEINNAEIELEVVDHVSLKNITRLSNESVGTILSNALHETENDENRMGDESAGNKNKETTQEAFPGCSSTQTLSEKCFSNPVTDNRSEESLIRVPSGCTTPSESKKTYDTYKNIQDIYDKLDSNSVSESESSFQIHEKTSQVINITDLTYSLEDLSRLDKICRVIEISDELSDKLLSPLDSETYQSTSGRNWSFQDFCERIKFDDFCNELFEKSAS